MIEGLKVTVKGGELRDLADARARHHGERVATYKEQIENMNAAKVEGMDYSNGDPVRALSDRATKHANEERELRFIADHIEPTETYLLDRDALHRLGIVSERY